MIRKHVIVIVSAIILSILTAGFQSNQTFASSFNPGYIVSDSIFTNSTSMSANSIQSFINSKGVNCTDGAAPCLKNYVENGNSAGSIIAQAAQTYSINPQVILTTLQKENGLLTANKPSLSRYQTAMGYGCPDTAACDTQYYGFTNQVNKAASMFHRIMIYDPTWYSPYQVGANFVLYSPTTSCGGTNVTIQNRATAALYDYTPYQPNSAALAAGYGTGDGCSAYGNRNFWLYFNDWFGSSISSMLIQSPSSQAIYLQSGNNKFGIPSWDVINAYGFGKFGVTPVSDTYMNSLNDGGTLSTVFSNSAEPGPVYLADNGYRFGFATAQQCVDWGFPNCTSSSYAKPLDPSLFNNLSNYGAISPLMLNGTHISLMKNGQKLTFLNSQAQIDNGYGSTPYTPITNPLNIKQPFGNSFPQNNSFVSFKNNSVIYAYSNNNYYPLTFDAYTGLSSTSTPTLYDDFSSYVTTPPIPAATVGPFIGFNDGSTFTLSAGKKIDTSAVKANWPTAQNLSDLQTISNRRPSDSVAQPNSTYRTNSGTIFSLENGTWRGFYSLSDYFALGNSSPIAVSDDVLKNINQGTPIFAPGNGSLYQVATPGSQNLIYTLSSDGTTCQMYSLSQIGLYNFNSADVYRISSLTNQTTNTLGTNVYDEAGNLHITYAGIHSIIPKSDLSSIWGITNRMNLCSLSSQFLSKNTVNKAEPKFVRDENTGVIYYGQNGMKRAIYSYDAFLRMGGTSDNTLNVSSSFLDASPNGVPIVQ